MTESADGPPTRHRHGVPSTAVLLPLGLKAVPKVPSGTGHKCGLPRHN